MPLRKTAAPTPIPAPPLPLPVPKAGWAWAGAGAAKPSTTVTTNDATKQGTRRALRITGPPVRLVRDRMPPGGMVSNQRPSPGRGLRGSGQLKLAVARHEPAQGRAALAIEVGLAGARRRRSRMLETIGDDAVPLLQQIRILGKLRAVLIEEVAEPPAVVDVHRAVHLADQIIF